MRLIDAIRSKLNLGRGPQLGTPRGVQKPASAILTRPVQQTRYSPRPIKGAPK